ncbi:MAG TPA: response regulator [Kofleriaceae bacterium]
MSTPRSILIVDDTPANLVAAEAALEPLARPIVTAASGEQALEQLLTHDFALILLDVNMPGMSGFEVARLIRGRERTAHVPIIFITAFDHSDAAVLRAYELGAVDFLFKPVVAEVLRAKASVFIALQERTLQLDQERIDKQVLAETDRRKDSFIAILAHELRNPLAPLRTCVDLIRMEPTRPLTPKMIDVLDRQTSVLSRLIDDLLDLSRIKADKIELRPEPIDLVDVVEGAIGASKPFTDERRHAVELEAPTDRIKVIVDAVRVTQVLCNLLNNAARYTPTGGRIVVTCGAADGFAHIRVTDNGIGIPVELQESVFNLFVQERVRSDGSGGLGLGLTLSHRLMEMHKGTITVHSAGRGQGSSFELTIPLADSPLALPIRKRTSEMKPLRALPSTLRTVVVDDNEDARELLSDLLRAKGFDVLTARDGYSGVRIIAEQRPHLALVDIGLPGLDGFGVLDELRKQVPDLETRLIALTGYGDASDRERTRQAGFHAHLVKPASADAIIACIAEYLEPQTPE